MTRTQRRNSLGLILSVGLWFAPGATAAAAQDAPASAVAGSLLVPAAETHVIGDDIPLVWRFHNTSKQPLAFMWEGCCRLNGRLTVTVEQQAVPAVPPGSALAHQFAKAERLDPGQARDFQTLLTDWVMLPGTGRYRIEGRYTGVLSNQFPQVPKTLALWRGQLEAQPITVDLLDVDDYLGQREARTRQRGLSLDLAGGVELLPPLDPITLTLQFQNLAQTPVHLEWPGRAQLWIVSTDGRRLGSRHLVTEPGPLNLPPQARMTRPIRLRAEDLLDAPFGSYRVFVDLPSADPGQPRVPSPAVDLRWEWSRATVADLVARAAAGTRTGLRNPALKLLRVYLGSIGNDLRALDASSLAPKAAELAKELALASCLKPSLPSPGRVDLAVALSGDGAMAFKDSTLAQCFELDRGEAQFFDRLKTLLRVRRHLGWTVGLMLEPVPAMTMDRVMTSVRALMEHQADLAGSVGARVLGRAASVTNNIYFQASVVPANLVIKLRADGASPRIEMARKLPDPAQPQLEARFAAEELERVAFVGLTDSAALKALLADGRLPFPQILVLAEPDLAWSQVLEALRPAIDLGRPMDLMVVGPTSGTQR